MSSSSLNTNLVDTMKQHLRVQRNRGRRPMFVFCCGGDREKHQSRTALSDYINASKRRGLNNVFCIVAEDMSDSPEFSNLDLLTQEAMICDVSDSLILFAESVGSFCELGAFSSLPHVRPIMAVAIDKKFAYSKSFLNGGPVRVVCESGFPLNGVYPVQLDNPMASSAFCSFVNGIRALVNEGEDRPFNKGRKSLNTDPKEIMIGSLVHELLDLVYLLGPIKANDLFDIYCAVKGFNRKGTKIVSRTIAKDMEKLQGAAISFEQVIAFMKCMDIVGSIEHVNGKPLFYANRTLDECFMFRGIDDREFKAAVSAYHLAARGRGEKGFSNVYRRFDLP